MFNTPHVGQPVQYLPVQGSEPLAAIIVRVDADGPSGAVTVKVFPPMDVPLPRMENVVAIRHMDAHGSKPLYPCWREAK